MSGTGTEGAVTSTMEFRTYCQPVGEDLWGNGAEVRLICASDSSIVVPTFYVKSRNADGNFTSWVCADRMSKTDVIVEFSDDDFKDGTISAASVLSRAASASGFSGIRYTSSTSANFITMIGDLNRESVEGKTARDIINSFAAAFCSYAIEGDGGAKTFTAGSGSAEDTLMISTEFASEQLFILIPAKCSAIFASGWTAPASPISSGPLCFMCK